MDDRTFQSRAGLFVFCSDFHSGQWSREYRIMSKLGANFPDSVWHAIRCAKCDPNGEWEIARETYHRLKERYLS